MPYIGNSPKNNVRDRFYYDATAGQTTFSGADKNGRTLAYQDGKYVDVYLNGVLLEFTTDYTAGTKTSVTLVEAAAADDLIEIIAYGIFSVADTVSATRGGTFEGNVNVTADLTVDTDTLYVDSTNNRVGIGTSSPLNSLHINKSSGDLLTRYVSGDGDDVAFFMGGQSSGANGRLLYDGSDNMRFYTNSSERMRIQSGGGISFNGDTAAVNALDDYEEGNWTPSITGVTYSTADGFYVKVGNLVTLKGILVNATSTGSSSNAILGGLPFTTANDKMAGTSLEGSGRFYYWNNITQASNGFSITPVSNTTTCNIYYVPTSGVASGAEIPQLNTQTLDGSSASYRFEISYFTD